MTSKTEFTTQLAISPNLAIARMKRGAPVIHARYELVLTVEIKSHDFYNDRSVETHTYRIDIIQSEHLISGSVSFDNLAEAYALFAQRSEENEEFNQRFLKAEAEAAPL